MESLVAQEQSVLVEVDPETGLLAYRKSPYKLSLEEIQSVFVEDAPFREERELLFSALRVYLRQTLHIVPDSKVWIDGSFISFIEDRPPSDVDILLIVNNPSQVQRNELGYRGLLTMSEVSGKLGMKSTPVIPKFAPYGGLVDAYYVRSDQLDIIKEWEFNWSTPKDESGQLDFTKSKGFVEVVC